MSSGDAVLAAGSTDIFDITEDISAVRRVRNSGSDSLGEGPVGIGMLDGSAEAVELEAEDGLPGPEDEGAGG